MITEPYAAPVAQVADAPLASAEPAFYVVSKKKFLLLYFATLGSYSLYWFYRNWRNFKTCTGADVRPVARAVFTVFFVHSLFRSVHATLLGAGRNVAWKPDSQATWLVGLLLLSKGLERLAAGAGVAVLGDLASLVLMIPLSMTYLRAQAMINLACNDEEGVGNSRLTGLNYLWIVLGVFLWMLALLGIAFPG